MSVRPLVAGIMGNLRALAWGAAFAGVGIASLVIRARLDDGYERRSRWP